MPYTIVSVQEYILQGHFCSSIVLKTTFSMFPDTYSLLIIKLSAVTFHGVTWMAQVRRRWFQFQQSGPMVLH